jgi:hypothetical protein
MNRAKQESSNKVDNMVPVSSQHTTNNNNGGNTSRRNKSIDRRQVSVLAENLSESRETMTAMEEMIKLSTHQAQEQETRMEEYMRHVEDRREALSEAMRSLAAIHSTNAQEIELERYNIDLEQDRVFMATPGSQLFPVEGNVRLSRRSNVPNEEVYDDDEEDVNDFPASYVAKQNN